MKYRMYPDGLIHTLWLMLLVSACGQFGSSEANPGASDTSFVSQKANLLATLEEPPADALKKAETYEEIAMLAYERYPGQTVSYLQQAAEFYKESKANEKAASCLLNAGCIYDERLHLADSALYFLQASIPFWEKTGNKNGKANVLKYQGVLEGKIGRLDDAKKHAQEAIDLFRETEHRPGLAVSYYDMACILDMADQPDSSLYFIEASQNIWEQQGNQERMFINNTLAMRVLTKQDKTEEALARFEINEGIRSTIDVHYIPLLSYFEAARQLLETVQDEPAQKKLEKEEKQLRKDLKRDGIVL
ncbi:MAG: tetratricopeptide repeat protein [Saprospiraceae bacterium]